MKRERYAPHGMLALAPRAFGLVFDLPSESPVERAGDAAIVSITGPLMSRRHLFFDSYEAIKARVAEALESKPAALVLRIDSPGGLVSGCFETARSLRAMASKAGVPVYAYVDGQACSAAYALACAADLIALPETAAVGSVGIIDAMVDASAAEAAAGVHTTIIGSGARKGDGNPSSKADGRAVAVAQERVDALAEVFFALVAESRPTTIDEVRALEAGVLFGSEAVSRGLADQVMSFDDLLAMVASSDPAASAAGESTMDKDEEARKALQAIVDDDESDEKSKARARKALAAMDEDDSEEESKAEDDEKKDDEEASASAQVPAAAAAAVASNANGMAKRLAAVESQLEESQRAALFASRPDLDPKVFDGVPFAMVKTMVARMPKPKAPKPAATATVSATRGEGQGDGRVSTLPAEYEAQVDRIMGLSSPERGVVVRDDKIIIGAEIARKGA